jgi:hypothetical protein
MFAGVQRATHTWNLKNKIDFQGKINNCERRFLRAYYHFELVKCSEVFYEGSDARFSEMKSNSTLIYYCRSFTLNSERPNFASPFHCFQKVEQLVVPH